MDEHIEQIAGSSRYMLEIWLNMYVTTTTYYKYGWTDHKPAVGDVVEITNKYRALGVIKN